MVIYSYDMRNDAGTGSGGITMALSQRQEGVCRQLTVSVHVPHSGGHFLVAWRLTVTGGSLMMNERAMGVESGGRGTGHEGTTSPAV